ncbi:MAG TPA: MmcQ/YjbR family DNA-binding protein [Saprospiraceae bacterium]|nr:MmcQ/YjbR family DNA-binding protein [Saprospiraceae bacterium]HQW54990.1 MmcQ/YjbR family DNA-binding protein [Saprospiraceae bacterium]
MINAEEFKDMALAFPGTGQKPHFDRVGFHIIGKQMFATYLPTDNTANIFLTPEEQGIFCKMDSAHIFPVPNKWGEKGATTFVLDSVDRDFVNEALLSAYESNKH